MVDSSSDNGVVGSGPGDSDDEQDSDDESGSDE
jgi:hypothetical protein